MSEGRGTVLNKLEKKSFYSFLILYIVSSSIFICLSAYWYYVAQKSSFQSNQYYKLQHIADKVSQSIVYAHMRGLKLETPTVDDDISIALIGINNEIQYGSLTNDFSPTTAEYVDINNHNILVSDSPQEHLDIKYVVVESNVLFTQIKNLKENVFTGILVSIFVMIILASILSRFFMRPLHQKIKQIEDFVHDTAHELNTPITALSMSVSRALKKETYDAKILKNISISTKQLFDIYNALSYLSFDSKEEESPKIDVSEVLKKSVDYYQELAQCKIINLEIQSESFMFNIDEAKLTMLFGNLINNAIKYSPADSEVRLSLKDGMFRISDNGIGIEKEKLTKIFDRFNRETEYSGGFGIGLSIVKKICQEYDLTVTVESEINKGSSFTVIF